MSSKEALRRSPNPGALTAHAFKTPADLIDDQCRQGLAFHVLGDHEQRTTRFCHLLEKRKHVPHDPNLSVGQQDVRVFQHGLHAFRIGDEVGRKEPTVELHPLDQLESGLGCLRFLDRYNSVTPNLFHRVGDELADGLVIVS